MSQSYNPDEHAHRFGLFRFRSPLLTESLLVFFSSSYLDVSVQRVYDFVYTSSKYWVAPFGHLRINARLQLPVVFRSLPRPSSSPGAKASPMRPYSLPYLQSTRDFSRHGSLVRIAIVGSICSFHSSLYLANLLYLSFPVLSMNF